MLSIGAMGHGQGSYYVGLAKEDYYLAGGEPPGVWLGAGARALGLVGEVEREAFLRVFHGFAPDGDRALVQNAGDARRQPGWDHTFSAPKSVSTLWAVLDQAGRAAIQEAHFTAVKEALSFIEEKAAFTRRGKGGAWREAARLVIATFEHGTSRAQDPQLHTHALILNVAVREDGTTGSLVSAPFYDGKMLTGALYRAELARRLETLGYAVERRGVGFEVAGVPERLMAEFSKRRAQVLERLAENGKETAEAAAVAALGTRSVKEHVARDALLSGWREVAEAFGFTQATARALRRPAAQRDPRDIPAEARAAVAAGLEDISARASHFSEFQLLRAVAEAGQARGLGAAHLRAAVRREVESGALVTLGDLHGQTRYTTKELFALETSMLATVEGLRSGKNFAVREATLTRAIAETEAAETRKARKADAGAETRSLNDEQRHALRHITQGEGRIAAVSGMAGTGKTFLLSAARAAWEREGRRVMGATIGGKAARGLQEGAGIESTSIAKLLHDLGKGPMATLKHHVRQIARAAAGKPTYALERLKLDANTVLVVDEAGMVGTRQMDALVSACHEAGAKLVLVGDARQLQPVEVGGPFRAILERVGKAELKRIVRQEADRGDKDPYWRRDAVMAFAEGRARDALAAYAERGFVSVAGTRDEAKESLIARWKERGAARPKDALILAGTRKDAADLNAMAQEARRAAGKLGFRSARVGGVTIRERDRVLITKNHKGLGVSNGDLGTVKRIEMLSRRMIVALDDGRTVSLPLLKFQDVTLGYAVTTHKGQGATVRSAYVLCGGGMTDREMSYVQASRARRDTHFFTERLDVWDPGKGARVDRTLERLALQMSRSRQKDLAHDVPAPPREHGREPELLPVL